MLSVAGVRFVNQTISSGTRTRDQLKTVPDCAGERNRASEKVSKRMC